MEPEILLKIEKTVLQILKNADMDKMTEFKVRVMASERLGMDLSDIRHRRFIRGVVENFLLTTMEVNGGEDANFREETQGKARDEPDTIQKKEFDSDGNRIICKLSNKRNVVIQDFKGKSFVSIREFYHKDGRQLPSNKGICLTAEQWSTFRNSVPLIEEAIMKMQSKLRSGSHGEKNEQVSNVVTASATTELNGQASNFVTASMPHELNGQVSKSVTANTRGHNDQVSDSVIASSLHEPFPIEINRFDGKNYKCWAPLMELFLKQLKIAYVLTNPCPGGPVRPCASAEAIAEAKAAEQKWLNDDYMCRHNILAFLSDALYYQYSKKTKSAKELWEELKLVHLYEEFGKKRSQVKKYMEFQIVDEKPVLDQVKELNGIADSLVATGISVDEKFHVSAIISKLPPSWKDFCIKLMCEEYLPFWMLMDRVRVEEESRNQGRQVERSNSPFFNHAKNLGPRMKDMKNPGLNGKRQETEIDNKGLICYFCGKKGHISKHCRSKKPDNEANEKLRKGNLSAPAVTEGNTELC